ncbi:MAG TPA: very short patch repair endonuclease [Xanthobacteraceae bacterium]|nr:very short patch repair endonuclease [Xanthobacteraceae bacterium]
MAFHRKSSGQACAERPNLRTGLVAKPARSRESYPSDRSWTMAQIRSKNTKPEIAVRKAAHAAGLRFRLHRKDLPGTPDLVFPSREIAVFVHGCFWHRHDCGRATLPATNVDYWAAKFDRNVRRDARNAAELRKLGWRCVRIWECETKDAKKLAGVLRRKVAAKTPRCN